jgi:Ca2+-transporting ATPase
MNWHTLSTDTVLKELQSNLHGLSNTEVEERILKYGTNEIQDNNKKSPFLIFLNQFSDFMILVLIAVAIISGFIGELTDSIIIIVIIILNAIIGFIQEYKAEASVQALKKMASLHAHVKRNNTVEVIEATQLVPGDIVEIQAGSIIPADIRFLQTHALRINESALTGESVPVDKYSGPINETDIALGDRLNMGYKNTLVTNGRAIGVVTGTGMNTEIGKIAGLLKTGKSLTPLQKRMESFSKILSYIILLLCVLLFISGVMRGDNWKDMLLLSISLAVAAIPEALPALITVCLSLGARRMVKKQALIRNLPAVETLGSVNFICTDKTGTLTENRMEVTDHFLISKEVIVNSYTPLELALALNHDIHISGNAEVSGDPTEIALLDYFNKQFTSNDYNALQKQLPRIHELPFDSVRKMMSTVHRFNDKFLVLVKGAPEAIASVINNHDNISLIEATGADWSSEGKRVLAFAYKIIATLPPDDSIEMNLNAAGLIAMMDPPRESAKKAIADCKAAGIETVMITGDHPSTAKAIAQQLGILDKDDLVRSSDQLKRMSEAEFEEQAERIKVYARVSPEQKLQIIKALQKKNYYVAMTGDGVNDAPSLKAANIGVAMGITGTDVSKEAADMILLDDNFGTIAKAVREGRRIYDNIRKFIKYILTCNSAEILIMILAPVLMLPVPLLPVHLLWVNLVTDGLPGLALASEHAEEDIMKQPPRKMNENIFSNGLGWHIIRVAIIMSAVTLGMQAWAIHEGLEHWQTMVFVTLSFAQLGHIMAIKSNKKSFLGKDLFTNIPLLFIVIFTILLQVAIVYIPLANNLLKTQPLTVIELLICFGVSSIVPLSVEIEKWIQRLRTAKN